MARYTDSVCRLCRREGCKLFLKGDKCMSDKCAMVSRVPHDGRSSEGEKPMANKRPAMATVPGEHGQARQRKQSEYGMQLREKQKVKRTYGLLESQFLRYFEEAERLQGISGENLLVLLERRLDNVVYRLGFGASRPQARQMILHGHICVNGKKVNVASYLVKAGDVVSISAKSAESEHFKAMREGTGKIIPKWMTIDAENLKATVNAMPKREDIDPTIKENLIVELYSR